MNLESLIQDSKPQYAKVDKEKMIADVFRSIQSEQEALGGQPNARRATRQRPSRTGLSHQRTHLKRRIGGVAAAVTVLAAGTAFATGAASSSQTRLPVVGKDFDLLGDANFEMASIAHAVNEGLSQKVNESATDQGITLTIGNIYTEQDMFVFDMVESFDGSAASKPVITQDDMQLNIGGDRPVVNVSGGDFVPTKNSDSYAGNVFFTEEGGENKYQPLPEHFNLMVHINHIGAVKGHWDFTFPVSREKTTSASKVISPMKSVTDGKSTLTVKQVTYAPFQTTVDYELTQPVSYSPTNPLTPWVDDVRLFGDNREMLGGIDIVSTRQVGENNVIELCGLYQSLEEMPKVLDFLPDKNAINVPLSHSQQFPIDVNAQSGGDVKILGVDFLPDKTVVHVQNKNNDHVWLSAHQGVGIPPVGQQDVDTSSYKYDLTYPKVDPHDDIILIVGGNSPIHSLETQIPLG